MYILCLMSIAYIYTYVYIYIYIHVLYTYTHMILRCYAGRGSRSARASTAAGQPRPISCNVTYAHTLSTSYIVSLYTLSIHLGRERERGRERGREGGWEGGRERERGEIDVDLRSGGVWKRFLRIIRCIFGCVSERVDCLPPMRVCVCMCVCVCVSVCVCVCPASLMYAYT